MNSNMQGSERENLRGRASASKVYPLILVARTGCAAGIAGSVGGAIAIGVIWKSSLAVLGGLLLVGPACALAGLFWELTRRSRTAQGNEGRLIAAGLIATWCVTLAYTLNVLLLSPRLAIGAISIQLFGVCATDLAIWYLATLRIRAFATSLATLVLTGTAAASAFPPIKPTTATMPFAFFLDDRFLGAHHPPTIAISASKLVMEWAILSAVLLVLMITARFGSRPEQA